MTPSSDAKRLAARSTVLAFFIAPLATIPATAIFLAIAYLPRLGDSGGASPRFVLTSLATFCMFAVPLAYLAATILGIPAYLAARRLGLLGLGQALAIGAVVALLPLWLFFAFVLAVDGLPVVRDLRPALGWTVLFAACGASAGATFWRIALRARPPVGA